jgi:hypothetical protein
MKLELTDNQLRMLLLAIVILCGHTGASYLELI